MQAIDRSVRIMSVSSIYLGQWSFGDVVQGGDASQVAVHVVLAALGKLLVRGGFAFSARLC